MAHVILRFECVRLTTLIITIIVGRKLNNIIDKSENTNYTVAEV